VPDGRTIRGADSRSDQCSLNACLNKKKFQVWIWKLTKSRCNFQTDGAEKDLLKTESQGQCQGQNRNITVTRLLQTQMAGVTHSTERCIYGRLAFIPRGGPRCVQTTGVELHWTPVGATLACSMPTTTTRNKKRKKQKKNASAVI